jgi:hypothetical protein
MQSCLDNSGPSRWMLRCLLGLVVLSTGWRIAARAEESVRSVSILVSASDAFSWNSAGYFEHYGMERFSREPGFEVIDPEELLKAPAQAQDSKEFEAALGELKKGMNNYENLELVKAVGELACAADLFEKVPIEVAADGGRRYISALTYLGAAFILKGELQQGQDSFRRLVVFDRRAKLDESIFPPSMVETFKSVWKDVDATSTGSLKIFSIPGEARVYIDGVFRCVSPCSVDDLPEGKHLLVVQKLGFESWGGTAMVEKKGAKEKRCRLLDLPGGEELVQSITRFSARMEQADRLDESLAALLRPAKLDQVALGRLTQRGERVSALFALYDVGSGARISSHEAVLHPGDPEFVKILDGFFSTLITGRSDVLQSEQVAGKGRESWRFENEERFEEKEPAPVYKTWWFWTAIGAGVATVATLLAVFVPRSSEPESMILLEF